MKRFVAIHINELKGVIIAEASLSFLGFGLPAQIPSWRGMLGREGRKYMEQAPWLRCRTWMVFAEGTEDFFNNPVLGAQCSFTNPKELSIDVYVDRQKKGLTPLTSIPGEAWGGPNEWQHGLIRVKREEWDNT